MLDNDRERDRISCCLYAYLKTIIHVVFLCFLPHLLYV